MFLLAGYSGLTLGPLPYIPSAGAFRLFVSSRWAIFFRSLECNSYVYCCRLQVYH